MAQEEMGKPFTMPVKGSDEEMVIPQEWISKWNEIFYDVDKHLYKAKSWCYDRPERQKTRRGMRSFLGRWIRRDAVIKPIPVSRSTVVEEKPKHDKAVTSAAIGNMRALLNR